MSFPDIDPMTFLVSSAVMEIPLTYTHTNYSVLSLTKY